jgi:hypothetical protein
MKKIIWPDNIAVLHYGGVWKTTDWMDPHIEAPHVSWVHKQLIGSFTIEWLALPELYIWSVASCLAIYLEMGKPTITQNFGERVEDTSMYQCSLGWNFLIFCRLSMFMWRKGVNIWESRFVLLSSMQVGTWRSSHLSILGVAWVHGNVQLGCL